MVGAKFRESFRRKKGTYKQGRVLDKNSSRGIRPLLVALPFPYQVPAGCIRENAMLSAAQQAGIMEVFHILLWP